MNLQLRATRLTTLPATALATIRATRLTTLPATALLAVLFYASCADPARPNYEYMPDMVDSVAFESFSANPVTRDGKTMMLPAPHSLARGAKRFPYGSGPEEAARAGRELTNPLVPTPILRARGEKVFLNICAPCHGAKGTGDGPIIPRFPTPPSLLAPHARGLADGQVFHIITRGQGLMPAHAAQVTPNDRWTVVLFLRALQSGAVK